MPQGSFVVTQVVPLLDEIPLRSPGSKVYNKFQVHRSSDSSIDNIENLHSIQKQLTSSISDTQTINFPPCLPSSQPGPSQVTPPFSKLRPTLRPTNPLQPPSSPLPLAHSLVPSQTPLPSLAAPMRACKQPLKGKPWTSTQTWSTATTAALPPLSLTCSASRSASRETGI